MNINLTKSDFGGLGKIATHCNTEKLQISINEAIEFDLHPILCDFFYAVDDHWNDTSGAYYDLINGSEYINCKGNLVRHAGLKQVLAYFSYARYIVINNFDDTPNGQVTKDNAWSIPKPLNELQNFSTKYSNMAREMWNRVEEYLCLQGPSVFPTFGFSACQSCGCNGRCGAENVKAFGLKSSIVTKN